MAIFNSELLVYQRANLEYEKSPFFSENFNVVLKSEVLATLTELYMLYI
jgi:hypothetical protein